MVIDIIKILVNNLYAIIFPQMSIGGDINSKLNKQLFMSLKMCVNTTANNNKCASKEDIQAAFVKNKNFFMIGYFINPIINPSQTKHIDYYLEEKNFLIFSRNMSSSTTLQFSDYQINTDVSLLPFQSLETQKGYICQTLGANYNYVLSQLGSLGIIRILKGDNQLKYKRTVLKLSQVVSFMGGLIGFLVSLMFLMKSYTSLSLEMNLSADLFYQKPMKIQQNNQENQQNIQQNQVQNQEMKDKIDKEEKGEKFQFSFWKYLQFHAYKFFSICKKSEHECFKTARKMQQYQQEINKQLDIKLLIQRIIKLEACLNFMLDKEEVQGLRNMKAITLQKAKTLRSVFQNDEKYSDQSQQAQQNQGQNENQQQINQNLKNNQDLLQKNNQLKEHEQKSQMNSQMPIKTKLDYLGHNQGQEDQSARNSSKRQQFGSPVSFIPVQFIKNDKILDDQLDKKPKGQYFDNLSKKTFKKLKQLGKKANESQFKKKIFDNLNIEVRRSIKKILDQQQQQISNISLNKIQQNNDSKNLKKQ